MNQTGKGITLDWGQAAKSTVKRSIAWGYNQATLSWHCTVMSEAYWTQKAVRESACGEVLLRQVFMAYPDKKEGICPECKARATRFVVEET